MGHEWINGLIIFLCDIDDVIYMINHLSIDDSDDATFEERQKIYYVYCKMWSRKFIDDLDDATFEERQKISMYCYAWSRKLNTF